MKKILALALLVPVYTYSMHAKSTDFPFQIRALTAFNEREGVSRGPITTVLVSGENPDHNTWYINTDYISGACNTVVIRGIGSAAFLLSLNSIYATVNSDDFDANGVTLVRLSIAGLGMVASVYSTRNAAKLAGR